MLCEIPLWVRKSWSNTCPWHWVNRVQREKKTTSAKPGGHLPTQQTRCVTRDTSGFRASRVLENKVLSSLLSGCVVWTCCWDYTPWWRRFSRICSAPGGRQSWALNNEVREGVAGRLSNVNGLYLQAGVRAGGRGSGDACASWTETVCGLWPPWNLSSKCFPAIVSFSNFSRVFSIFLCIVPCVLDIHWSSHSSPGVFTCLSYFLSCISLYLPIVHIDIAIYSL